MLSASTTSTTSAVDHVFTSPELLENILLHLIDVCSPDLIDRVQQFRLLLGLQCVCKQFRDVVSQSRTLRCAMYLEPADATTALEFGLYTFNPLFWYLNYHLEAFQGTCFRWDGTYDLLYRRTEQCRRQCGVIGLQRLYCNLITETKHKGRESLLQQQIDNMRAALEIGFWRKSLVNNTNSGFNLEFQLCVRRHETLVIREDFPAHCTMRELIEWVLAKLQQVWHELEADSGGIATAHKTIDSARKG